MVQMPVALKVTTAPDFEQTLLLVAMILIFTARPEVAEAAGV